VFDRVSHALSVRKGKWFHQHAESALFGF
jgi:hypothetical protein